METEVGLMQDNKQFAQEILAKLKELVRKGNVTKIQISRKGENVVTFPLNVGVVAGVAVAPWALIAAAIATLGASCSIDVVKENGEVVRIV